MALRNLVGESAAGAAASYPIGVPTGSHKATFDSLTISTKGADVSADIKVSIIDGARTRWAAYLRNGQIYGAHFNDIGDIQLNNDTLTVATTSGGAGVIVATAAVIHIE
jgi:hypothetical protein